MVNLSVKLLSQNNIPSMAEIWNANAPFLTSDGKTHTVKSLSVWYNSQEESGHQIYGIYRENSLSAEEDLIGFCITYEAEDISWIKMFAVEEKYRRQGYGRKALKETESKLLQKRIRCEVKENNPQALKFFTESGYKKIEFDQMFREFILEK